MLASAGAEATETVSERQAARSRKALVTVGGAVGAVMK
jgi:hypothetical protein